MENIEHSTSRVHTERAKRLNIHPRHQRKV
jgi:hypothetical protein